MSDSLLLLTCMADKQRKEPRQHFKSGRRGLDCTDEIRGRRGPLFAVGKILFKQALHVFAEDIEFDVYHGAFLYVVEVG